ncbi:MAG: response regulator transcription factor [Planctomycetota bacterium]
MKTIAVIEDEPDIRNIIEYNLQREGYRAISAEDGKKGLDLIRSEMPDLVLLDIMLPRMSGLDVCRSVKGDSKTRAIPVILVSAKGEESDVVHGLRLGADDYIPKPFSMKVMLARVKAILRRSQQGDTTEGAPEENVAFGNVCIEPDQYRVTVNDEPVKFTITEFKMLLFFARHPGRVFTRDQIMTAVLGEDAIVVDRNIDVHIRAIRKKIGKFRDFIETVRGVGYRFNDEQ